MTASVHGSPVVPVVPFRDACDEATFESGLALHHVLTLLFTPTDGSSHAKQDQGRVVYRHGNVTFWWMEHVCLIFSNCGAKRRDGAALVIGKHALWQRLGIVFSQRLLRKYMQSITCCAAGKVSFLVQRRITEMTSTDRLIWDPKLVTDLLPMYQSDGFSFAFSVHLGYIIENEYGW